jgi:hypothetical protein
MILKSDELSDMYSLNTTAKNIAVRMKWIYSEGGESEESILNFGGIIFWKTAGWNTAKIRDRTEIYCEFEYKIVSKDSVW